MKDIYIEIKFYSVELLEGILFTRLGEKVHRIYETTYIWSLGLELINKRFGPYMMKVVVIKDEGKFFSFFKDYIYAHRYKNYSVYSISIEKLTYKGKYIHLMDKKTSCVYDRIDMKLNYENIDSKSHLKDIRYILSKLNFDNCSPYILTEKDFCTNSSFFLRKSLTKQYVGYTGSYDRKITNILEISLKNQKFNLLIPNGKTITKSLYDGNDDMVYYFNTIPESEYFIIFNEIRAFVQNHNIKNLDLILFSTNLKYYFELTSSNFCEFKINEGNNSFYAGPEYSGYSKYSSKSIDNDFLI